MFGDSFLTAPVVDRGATKWEVYLPVYSSDFGSRWLDVWSNFKVEILRLNNVQLVSWLVIIITLYVSMTKVMDDLELDLENITAEEGKRYVREPEKILN